jgi:type III secretory pathway component EscT
MRGWAAPALVVAALADSITFVLLPTGAEVNPIAASYPYASLVAKAALVVLLIAWHHRYARPLRAFGTVAWTLGALSNALVLGGI